MLAATVVSHGELWATVLAAGPLLPAEVAAKTPASAENRNASSTGSTTNVREPENERLMTSTPSAVAWSIAAAMSSVEPLAVPSGWCQPIL